MYTNRIRYAYSPPSERRNPERRKHHVNSPERDWSRFLNDGIPKETIQSQRFAPTLQEGTPVNAYNPFYTCCPETNFSGMPFNSYRVMPNVPFRMPMFPRACAEENGAPQWFSGAPQFPQGFAQTGVVTQNPVVPGTNPNMTQAFRQVNPSVPSYPVNGPVQGGAPQYVQNYIQPVPQSQSGFQGGMTPSMRSPLQQQPVRPQVSYPQSAMDSVPNPGVRAPQESSVPVQNFPPQGVGMHAQQGPAGVNGALYSTQGFMPVNGAPAAQPFYPSQSFGEYQQPAPENVQTPPRQAPVYGNSAPVYPGQSASAFRQTIGAPQATQGFVQGLAPGGFSNNPSAAHVFSGKPKVSIKSAFEGIRQRAAGRRPTPYTADEAASRVAQSPQKQPTPRKKAKVSSMDNRLYLLIIGILLPLLFFACLYSPLKPLRIAFLVIGVLVLIFLWWREALNMPIRIGATGLYLVMMIFMLSSMTDGGIDVAASLYPATATPAPTAQPQELSVMSTPIPVFDEMKPEETTVPLSEVPACRRLEEFMNLWRVNDATDMVNYVQPSWRKRQSDPTSQLFMMLGNRTPVNFVIEEISGDATDTSRTVTMSAEIDKNTGKATVKYRFMVLMVEEDYIITLDDGTQQFIETNWYVNPNSLATNDEIVSVASEETNVVNNKNAAGNVTAAPTTTVTPVPPGDTVLYYNVNGGSFYHKDAYCPGVKDEYLPLTGSFYYSELKQKRSELKLQPCLKCGAPINTLESAQNQ